ncbi:MAG: protein kinase domain-containing protein [Bradymonadia bacterium]
MKFCPQCQTEYPQSASFCPKDGVALRARVDDSDALIGELLAGKYRVDVPLGSGAMGKVYRGYNVEAGKQVALKLIRCQNAQDEAYRARFEREKAIIGQLRHPNSITLYDSFNIDADQLVIVTELVTGQTLEEMLQINSLPVDEVLFILREVADALVEAHGKGIIHRDLKPSNIMLEKVGDRNVVKVLDYGVARLHDSRLTSPSQPGLGTELYMSPEQRLGLPDLDGRSDIYSLGVIAYQCLAEHSDFQGRIPGRLSKRFTSDLAGYGTAGPGEGVSAAVQDLIIACLAEKREGRPASASTLRDKVDEIRYVSSPHFSRILAEQTGSVQEAPPVPLDSSNPESMIGRVLKGKYRIDSKLGAGAMGSVFRAHDLDAQMDVALKIVNAAWANNEDVVKRFEQEKSIIAQMRHPNILKLKTSFQTPAGELVIVTELVHGETLQDRIPKGDMPIQEALFIIREVADALAETHAKGIIHRDLKPANLMLETLGDKLMIKVLDFGVAKVHDSKLTATGLTVGTLAYMSPEQLTASELDGRTDIYSLGAIGYHCLASQTTFRGRGPEMLIQHFGQGDGDSDVADKVPADVEDLILDCLRRDPSRRPADARALRDRADALRAKYSGYTNPPDAIKPSANMVPRPASSDTVADDLQTAADDEQPGAVKSEGETAMLAAQLTRSKKIPALLAACAVLLAIGLYVVFTRTEPSVETKAQTIKPTKTNKASTQKRSQKKLRARLAGLKRKAQQAEAKKNWKAAAEHYTQWLKAASNGHPERTSITERRTQAAANHKETLTPIPAAMPATGQKPNDKAAAKQATQRRRSPPKGKPGVKSPSTKRSKSKNQRFKPMAIKPQPAPPKDTLKPIPKAVPKKRDIRGLFTTE